MNTATMDGSRALYGISQDGMTTKWLGRLNRYSVPAIAMTMDVILNLFLISYFGYPLDILAAGNLGYMLAHVFALSGFLLLRRDRPNWPRPIKLAAAWMPDRGAARCGQPAVHRHRRVHLRGQVRLRLGQDLDRHSACSRSACCSTSTEGSWRTTRASTCARRRRPCRRTLRRQRRPPRRRSSRPPQAYSGRSSHFGSSAMALR